MTLYDSGPKDYSPTARTPNRMEYVTRLGEELPVVGLGTWQMQPTVAYESVSTALEVGYRHIDTAQAYGNEHAVGRAINDARVSWDDVFLTTKVHQSNRSVTAIVDSVEESLQKLQCNTVDLLLIHWPHPLANLETVMRGLNRAVDSGYTRYIGVSNFGRDRLDRARQLSDAPIFTNQVLFHLWWTQPKLRRYCVDHDIVLTAYSPLANGHMIGNPVLEKIGERYGKTSAQVAIRWVIQHENMITIPMSTNKQHLMENLDVFDFQLTPGEIDQITQPSYLKTGISTIRGQLGI